MRIERVEVITLRVPWGPDEWGQFRDWPVVRIHADDGRVGMGRGGDARLIRAEFEELLVGQDPARISLHWQRMFDRAWRFPGTRAGCDELDLRHRHRPVGPSGPSCGPAGVAAAGRAQQQCAGLRRRNWLRGRGRRPYGREGGPSLRPWIQPRQDTFAGAGPR